MQIFYNLTNHQINRILQQHNRKNKDNKKSKQPTKILLKNLLILLNLNKRKRNNKRSPLKRKKDIVGGET
jgi:hypothetical protein